MSDTKALGVLGIGLLGLMVVMGLVFIVGDQYLETICTNIDEGYWQATSSSCTNSSTDFPPNLTESDAFNETEKVIDAIKLITAFLTIIVLVFIVKLLVRTARSVSGGQ